MHYPEKSNSSYVNMDFRRFSLAAWTLLVNNILCTSFGFNWHYCPQTFYFSF